jgi:hypothetical protein
VADIFTSSQYPSEAFTKKSIAAVAAVMGGVVLAWAWSYKLVDDVVAGSVANAILHDNLSSYDISSVTGGLIFAFVSGLAGTFTACNVCVLAAALPLASRSQPTAKTSLLALRPFLASLLIVASTYGFLGVLIGPSLPQLSESLFGTMPARLVQAGFVFVLLGVIMLVWGFAVLRTDGGTDRPTLTSSIWAQIALGALVAAFQVGRPFPPFRRMFEAAVEKGDPLYGAAAFGLQALGNVTLVLLIVAPFFLWHRGALPRALARHPHWRNIAISVGFLAGGAFMVAYWGVRVPARFGFGL